MQSDDVRVDQLEQAFGAFRAELDPSDVPDDRRLAVHRPYERWTFEELDEFFEELRREPGIPEVVEEYESHGFRIEPFDDRASVTVRAPSRDRVEEILRILDLTPALPDRHQTAAFTVFIGHGRNVNGGSLPCTCVIGTASRWRPTRPSPGWGNPRWITRPHPSRREMPAIQDGQRPGSLRGGGCALAGSRANSLSAGRRIVPRCAVSTGS